MTSDAKIGLLLGLVCIFIIAFIINGLPRFRNIVGNDELTTTMNDIAGTDNGAVGIGTNERNAPGVFNWRDTVVEEIPEAVAREDTGYMSPWGNNTFAADNTPEQGNYYNNDFQDSSFEQNNYAYDPALAYQEIEPEPVVPDSTATADQEEVRYEIEFPFVSAQEVVSINDSDNQAIAQEHPLNGGYSIPGGQHSPAQSTNQNQQTSQQVNQSNKPRPYTIEEGDGNLANIAKKFYGEVEGNRIVNVNRIYEANKNVLKSADEIFVGQKLVIPPLPNAPAQNNQSGGILNSNLFERVRSIGGGRAENIRWYEVKENDSLWKIADKELGDGNRYKEISKLNANILSDENDLKLGMLLQLPTK